MDDSALFMEWAMELGMLEQEHHMAPFVIDCDNETIFQSLHAIGDISHSRAALIVDPEQITGGDDFSAPAAMDHYVWPPTSSSGPTSGSTWNFGCQASSIVRRTTAAAGELTIEPTKTRVRAALAPYSQDHIVAERRRREKINMRFIELSSVIPGLKKKDKASILSNATTHVKELQERIKALETTGSNATGVRKVSVADGSPPSASSGAPSALPEIHSGFLKNSVMVRIHCVEAKGMVARVLSEVEDRLHLRITHIDAMPFATRTIIITITAKLVEGLTVTADEIVGRLKSVLQ